MACEQGLDTGLPVDPQHYGFVTAYRTEQKPGVPGAVEVRGTGGEGVFLANLETAVNVVLDAAPRLGETVLLSGLGVVGLLVLQVLRRTGIDVPFMVV